MQIHLFGQSIKIYKGKGRAFGDIQARMGKEMGVILDISLSRASFPFFYLEAERSPEVTLKLLLHGVQTSFPFCRIYH